MIAHREQIARVHAGDGTALCVWEGPIPLPGERITVEAAGPEPEGAYKVTGTVKAREWRRVLTHTERSSSLLHECWIHVEWDHGPEGDPDVP